MPILEMHLVAGDHDAATVGALLEEASHLYVEVLYPELEPRPIERVRAFVTLHERDEWATATVLSANGGTPAPYFTCLVLAGRPSAQISRLLVDMTDLIATRLSVAKPHIRGRIIPIDPDHWCIGRELASAKRHVEIAGRAGAT